MHMHLNSDGFRVAEAARDLVRTGVRSANVSLDAATAAAHDRRAVASAPSRPRSRPWPRCGGRAARGAPRASRRSPC